jgi:arabinofuranosyltransferase
LQNIAVAAADQKKYLIPRIEVRRERNLRSSASPRVPRGPVKTGTNEMTTVGVAAESNRCAGTDPRIPGNTVANWLLALLPAISAAIYFAFVWRHSEVDDALIYLRYIRNFQDGHGLVYNPGEKFNGLTSPLFTYLVLGASFVTRNLQAATIALSAAFLAAASVLAGRLFATTRWGEILTSLSVASFGYFYATFGMETQLFLMLIALSLYLYKIESDYFVIALALLLATRSEGVFLAVPMTLDYLARRKRIPRPMPVLLGLAIFLTPFLVNYVYYGAILPATASAKLLQGKSGYWNDGSSFFDIGPLLDSTFSGSRLAVAALLALSIYGAFTLRKNRVALLAIVFSVLLLAFYRGFNLPSYHWYYAPFFLLLLVFSCAGLEAIATRLQSRASDHQRAGICLAVIALIALFYWKTMAATGGGRHENYARIGSWIKEHTANSDSVALLEIGTVGWYSERPIIDLLGLVNKYNAGYVGDREPYGWLTHYRPDYILRHQPRWPFEESTRVLEHLEAYVPVADFPFPGYVLLHKSDRYSDEQVSTMATRMQEGRARLSSVRDTSKQGAPNVALAPEGLFAHAPSSVWASLPRAHNEVYVLFGVRDSAEGLHNGVCFEIRRESNQERLFHQCIGRQAKGDALFGETTMAVNGLPGEKLLFNTVCMSSCDYAWSYWGAISIR